MLPSLPSSAGYGTVCVTPAHHSPPAMVAPAAPGLTMAVVRKGNRGVLLDSAGCRCKKPCIALSLLLWPVKINVLVLTLVAPLFVLLV